MPARACAARACTHSPRSVSIATITWPGSPSASRCAAISSCSRAIPAAPSGSRLAASLRPASSWTSTSWWSGNPGALPPRGPLRTARATFAAGSSSKPQGRAGRLCWVSALAGLEPAMAGGVHEAGCAATGGAWSPVVDKVAGGYCLAGDLKPPLFPLLRGLRWLIGGEQVIPAEWTAPVLPRQQAERVAVQRGFAALPPAGPVVSQGGIVGGRSALD